MKNLNASCVKASHMVVEVYVGPIWQNYISQFFVSNSGVTQWYKCLKIIKNMKNLNSSWVKASDTEAYICTISQNSSWQFFFLILE